jgi:hypothetical protein
MVSRSVAPTRAPAEGGLAVVIVVVLLLVQAGGSVLFGAMYGTRVLGPVNDDRVFDAEDARLGAGVILGGALAWLVGSLGARALWRRRGWLGLGAAGAAVLSLAAVMVLVTAPDTDPGPQAGHWPGVPRGMLASLVLPNTWPSLLLGMVGALVAVSRSRRRDPFPRAVTETTATGASAVVAVTVVVALGGLARTAVLDRPLTAMATAGFFTAIAATSLLLCQGFARHAGPRFALFRTVVVAVLTAGAGLALYVALVRVAYPPGGPRVITGRDGFGYGVWAGLFDLSSIPLTVGALLSLLHLIRSYRWRPKQQDEPR